MLRVLVVRILQTQTALWAFDIEGTNLTSGVDKADIGYHFKVGAIDIKLVAKAMDAGSLEIVLAITGMQAAVSRVSLRRCAPARLGCLACRS